MIEFIVGLVLGLVIGRWPQLVTGAFTKLWAIFQARASADVLSGTSVTPAATTPAAAPGAPHGWYDRHNPPPAPPVVPATVTVTGTPAPAAPVITTATPPAAATTVTAVHAATSVTPPKT